MIESKVLNPQTSLLLAQAKESGSNSFKIIAKVSDSGLSIMQWCDDAFNFDGMCVKSTKEEYKKNIYSLEELPEVLERASLWLTSVNTKIRMKNEDMLHLMVL